MEQLHIKATQFALIDAIRCKIQSQSIDIPRIPVTPTILGLYIG